MKNTIFLFIMLIAAGRLSAQNLHRTKKIAAVNLKMVSGTIKDTSGNTIPGATVQLISARDTMAKATGVDGAFTFTGVKSATFTVTVVSIGYRKFVKSYTTNAVQKSVALGTIVLQQQATTLKTVAVNGVAATIYKADTVTYSASDYKVRESTGINDLLQVLPGVEVGADGSVMRQGHQITRVRINGKDYFGDDAAQRLQNLPADIIEKAQVIDDYGDTASQTGIKSGELTTLLNITVTKDKKGKPIPPPTVPLNTPAPIPINEAYARLIENKYQNPVDHPLSTFSVDVDNASYSNIRRFINNGQLPPKDAVRIEEMINYFKYQLPEPKGNEPVAINTELASAQWNTNHRLLRIGLKARTIPLEKLPESNLVFLIDVSGSMYSANKLPLVKTSLKMLVDQLRAKDRVAIVVYAGNAGLVLPSTPGSDKETIKNAIDHLEAGGSTAGGAGIKLAYKVAADNFKKGGNNRIVLTTDGDFNVGESSDESMEQLITKERESGVDLSIMGFGMGNYKDSKMETLADKGNGNYVYIDNLTEAHKALVTEFSSNMYTVAKDVKLQVEFNPAKVQAYRLIGYENRMLAKEDFNNDKKDAGDMGSGHTVTAFYEIIPAGIKDDYAGSVDPLKYQRVNQPVATSPTNELLTVKFRYKEPQSLTSQLSQAVVLDKPKDFDKQPADYRFAASVAEIGMLLRDSEYKGKATYSQAIKIAKSAKAKDEEGYRSEFIRLAESVKALAKGTELATN